MSGRPFSRSCGIQSCRHHLRAGGPKALPTMGELERNIPKTANAVLFSSGILASAAAMASEQPKPTPLTIQDQGSFAVGGTMVQSPGAFDPYAPTPNRSDVRGDHACAQIRERASRCSCSGTAPAIFEDVETTRRPRRIPNHFPAPRTEFTRLISWRGNAGRSMVQSTIAPRRMSKCGSACSDRLWPTTFRAVRRIPRHSINISAR